MKTFLLYFLLVGIPIAALALVLNAGNGLVPPVTVEGEWAFAVPEGANQACLPVRPGRRVHLEQSGKWLSMTITGRRIRHYRGYLEADSIDLQAESEACDRMVLRAVIEGNPRAEVISGRWIPEQCAACPEIPAYAERYTLPED